MATFRNPVPGVKLLLLHNRDEFFDRPFTPGVVRDTVQGKLFHGTDLPGGGTWLAISPGGFAAVLSIRGGSKKTGFPLSRGALPLAAIEANDFDSCVKSLDLALYAPFHLVKGTVEGRHQHFNSLSRELQSSLHPLFSLTNRKGELRWYKEERLRSLVEPVLESAHSSQDLLEKGVRILTDPKPSNASHPVDTGFPPEMEHRLSPIFVTLSESGYGTVVSTAVAYLESGEVEILEKPRTGSPLRAKF